MSESLVSYDVRDHIVNLQNRAARKFEQDFCVSPAMALNLAIRETAETAPQLVALDERLRE